MRRFDLGQVVATPGALDAMQACDMAPAVLLQRHLQGDWGELSAEDERLNQRALNDGGRILSSYQLDACTRVWVITEAADEAGRRSATTLLLPDEY